MIQAYRTAFAVDACVRNQSVRLGADPKQPCSLSVARVANNLQHQTPRPNRKAVYSWFRA